MINSNHPITPPDELVEYWWQETQKVKPEHWVMYLAIQATRWGADQELEACCEWLQDSDSNVDTYELRAARRPKPPSLKEQALALLDDASDRLDAAHENTIRHAIESLPD